MRALNHIWTMQRSMINRRKQQSRKKLVSDNQSSYVFPGHVCSKYAIRTPPQVSYFKKYLYTIPRICDNKNEAKYKQS